MDVITPATLKEVPEELLNSEWDLFAVAAYGKLIPKSILEIPKRGCLNVHPSLLPKFRGPSPALSAILADERITGVTIMAMSEKMDEGPIVAQAKVELEAEDWPPKGSILEDMLAQEGGNLLAEILPDWIAGKITAEPQDEARATYTRKYTDQDALVDLEGRAREQLLKIRAFDTSPRAHFLDKRGTRVIVTEAEFKNGELEVLKVIPEGKKEMRYEDFIRGQK
jgi:methionyl-tRNA formyltransferase